VNWRTVLHPACVLAFLVLGVSAIGMRAAIDRYGLHLQKEEIHAPGRRQVSTIPRETPNWEQFGPDQVLDEDTVKTLGTNNFVSRAFRRKGGIEGERPMVIEFHAAYYTGGIDTVPHVPERCMVGGGWRRTKDARTLSLDLDSTTWVKDEAASQSPLGEVYTARTLPSPYSTAPGTRVRLPYSITPDSPIRMRVTEFESPDSNRRLLAGYFFVANGGVASSAEQVRTLAFNLTSDYAYYLKVQLSSATVESGEELALEGASLLSELMPEIMRCVPDWTLVESGEYPEDNPKRTVAGQAED